MTNNEKSDNSNLNFIDLGQKNIEIIIGPKISSLKSSTNKKLKRVSFSTTDASVTNLAFKKQKCHSIKELVDTYCKQCAIYLVRPIESVCACLLEFEQIPQILPKLDIGNVNLDSYSIEALECIFMHFTIKNLSAKNNIDDENAETLFDILKHYDNVVNIEIGNNRMTMRGYNHACHYFSNSFSLESVDLSNTNLNEHIIAAICSVISASFSIKILIFDYCNLNGLKLKLFSDKISKNNHIEELYLAGNKITSSDCEFIGILLKNCNKLQILDLENNFLSDSGFIMIIQFCMHFEITNIECLHLWNTGLTSISMPYLAAYLMNEKIPEDFTPQHFNKSKNEKIPKIQNTEPLPENHAANQNTEFNTEKKVSLSSNFFNPINFTNNFFSPIITNRLLSDTSPNLSFIPQPINLRVLNIGRNKIGDEGLLLLKSALIKNKSLEKLGLASLKLSSYGIITIAEIIADNRRLKRVDLRDNTVNVAGVLALSQGLRHNCTMIKINLTPNFDVNTLSEIELNKLLDDIHGKCLENREKNGINSDGISLASSSVERESTFDSVKNFISSPFRFAKSKFIHKFYKQDIEINAVVEERIVSEASLVKDDLKDDVKKDQLVGTRFFVSTVKKSHRRCRSEQLNLETKNEDRHLNAFIKLSKPDQRLFPSVNMIPLDGDSKITKQSFDDYPKLQKSFPPFPIRSRRASFSGHLKSDETPPKDHK